MGARGGVFSVVHVTGRRYFAAFLHTCDNRIMITDMAQCSGRFEMNLLTYNSDAKPAYFAEGARQCFRRDPQMIGDDGLPEAKINNAFIRALGHLLEQQITANTLQRGFQRHHVDLADGKRLVFGGDLQHDMCKLWAFIAKIAGKMGRDLQQLGLGDRIHTNRGPTICHDCFIHAAFTAG